jgi:hypothetical protein
MKSPRFIEVVVFVLLTLQVFVASAQTDIINQVKETIKAGSAKELSRYLNQTVEVSIEDKVQSYSKVQAELVLRDFFRQHPISEFSIIHQGSSKNGQLFALGQFKSGPETFRVFIKFKSVSNEQMLDEIRFSRE